MNVNDPLLLVVLVGVSLLLNIITLGVVISIKRKMSAGAAPTKRKNASSAEAAATIEAGVVFCRNCGSQFDSTRTVCPHCETAR
ncbi:hypothetical protein A8F94_07360 [Bacillus sp. FJAT-27225]|uniref:hypothetical protein n=1 Tax=Bacillus sp. FJAT-27225 TaxID=1743144 RepID=UPI00080C2A27|nr:hypothetical protein [Bacillus sp. FJAT-27225]OCA87664.1 hypothetical protein A8F94_07360 [Bacillus sp. FJAT-27225]